MFIAYFFCQLLSILHLICVSPILTGVVNQVLPANGYSTTSIGIQYTNENSRYIPVTGNTNENDRYIPETGNTNENDRYIPVPGNTNENDRYIPVTGNTNENDRYIPVTRNTNENDRYIPETGNTNGNDHYILIIGSYFIFVPWCNFSLIIGKISVKLFLSKLKLFLMK